MKKRWLCYQMVIEKENGYNVEMVTIIRNVGAENKEEALGKFILNTADIKAVKKLNPFCFELDDMMSID